MYKEIFEDFNKLNFDISVSLSENPIINILNYFKIGTYVNLSNINNRIRFDGDAQYVYYHSKIENKVQRKLYAKRADTMISFFTPYKYAILKKYGKMYTKTEDDLNELLCLANDGSYNEVNSHFKKFAELYQSPGNIIILPDPCKCIDGRMNCRKCGCSEDRIDKAIYECFEGGLLNKYFNNEQELKTWILQERLDSLFIDNSIRKEMLIPFTKEHPFIKYENMSLEEIYDFINKSVELINIRKSLD